MRQKRASRAKTGRPHTQEQKPPAPMLPKSTSRSLSTEQHGSTPLPGAANLRPGRALLLETTSKGGITYEPAAVENKDNAQTRSMVLRFDDRDLDRWVTAMRNYANNCVRRHGVHTDLGVWFVDEAALAIIEREIAIRRVEAYNINKEALKRGFARETRCEYFLLGWNHKDPKLAMRMGQLIYSRLTALKTACQDTSEKHSERYRVEWDKCRNLPKLVIGDQSELLQLALSTIETQHADPMQTGVDLKPLIQVITLFKPARDAFLFEYPDL